MFDWLFGKKQQASVWIGDGNYRFEIVGESYYQDNIASIAGEKTEDGHDYRCTAILEPQPNNPHDSNAVVVAIRGLQVGYLDRLRAVQYRRKLKALRLPHDHIMGCRAVIVGGWLRSDGDEGHYGVKLDLLWPLEPDR